MLRAVVLLIVALRARGGPSAESATNVDPPAPDAAYAADVRGLRRQVAGAVAIIYLGSAFLLVGLIVLRNRDASWYPAAWNRLDLKAGIERATTHSSSTSGWRRSWQR